MKMKMVELVVMMNNSEPLLWVVRGEWVKNGEEIVGCRKVRCEGHVNLKVYNGQMSQVDIWRD